MGEGGREEGGDWGVKGRRGAEIREKEKDWEDKGYGEKGMDRERERWREDTDVGVQCVTELK